MLTDANHIAALLDRRIGCDPAGLHFTAFVVHMDLRVDVDLVAWIQAQSGLLPEPVETVSCGAPATESVRSKGRGLAKSADQQLRPEHELDAAIRQIVSRAVVTDGVVDIFAAAWLQKPDISILFA